MGNQPPHFLRQTGQNHNDPDDRPLPAIRTRIWRPPWMKGGGPIGAGKPMTQPWPTTNEDMTPSPPQIPRHTHLPGPAVPRGRPRGRPRGSRNKDKGQRRQSPTIRQHPQAGSTPTGRDVPEEYRQQPAAVLHDLHPRTKRRRTNDGTIEDELAPHHSPKQRRPIFQEASGSPPREYFNQRDIDFHVPSDDSEGDPECGFSLPECNFPGLEEFRDDVPLPRRPAKKLKRLQRHRRAPKTHETMDRLDSSFSSASSQEHAEDDPEWTPRTRHSVHHIGRSEQGCTTIPN